MKGLFITMEGPGWRWENNCHQPTDSQLQKHALVDIVSTEENLVVIAEDIRKVILDVNNTEMDERTEAILYAAVVASISKKIVSTKLRKGNIVFCDRFVDSLLVYQGVARGIGRRSCTVKSFCNGGPEPSTTLLRCRLKLIGTYS